MTMKNLGEVRVATYGRFSSIKQDNEVIIGQEKAMMDDIKEKGYTLIESYADEVEVGEWQNRLQFEQMLADASKRKFDVILVHKLDQLSEDVFDMLTMQADLLKYGVTIESVTENYDKTPEGELFRQIQVGMNQYYSRNLERRG